MFTTDEDKSTNLIDFLCCCCCSAPVIVCQRYRIVGIPLDRHILNSYCVAYHALVLLQDISKIFNVRLHVFVENEKPSVAGTRETTNNGVCSQGR